MLNYFYCSLTQFSLHSRILLYSYAYCGYIRHLATSSLYNGNHRNFTFFVSFRSAMVLCQRMKLVCNVVIVVGCSCLPFSANEVTSVHVLFCLFKSICSCSSSPCYMIMWLVSQHFVTADIMEMHFSLVMVSANDWAIRCCYCVLTSFSELPFFFEATIFPMQR